MTVTDAERQRIIDEMLAEQKEALRQRMSKIGSRSTPRKRRASRKSLKLAVKARVPRTHCKNGHKYTKKNTAYWAGVRYCKTCNRLDARKQWRKKRAKGMRKMREMRIP